MKFKTLKFKIILLHLFSFSPNLFFPSAFILAYTITSFHTEMNITEKNIHTKYLFCHRLFIQQTLSCCINYCFCSISASLFALDKHIANRSSEKNFSLVYTLFYVRWWRKINLLAEWKITAVFNIFLVMFAVKFVSLFSHSSTQARLFAFKCRKLFFLSFLVLMIIMNRKLFLSKKKREARGLESRDGTIIN